MPKANEEILELSPILVPEKDYEKLEETILLLLKRNLYLPILASLKTTGRNLLQNAPEDFGALRKALDSGLVTFSRGKFSGKFNAQVSKELKAIGAKFNRTDSAFHITWAELPIPVKELVSSSESRFQEKMKQLDREIAKILPEEIADKLKASEMIDRSLYRSEQSFVKSVKQISVAPKLSDAARKKIAKDWETNLKLYIKDFANEEILKLRQEIKASVLAGNRYESLIGSIQKSYGVSANKAKFLARQETHLFITKFQENKLADVGIYEYTWHSVMGTPAHPVRPQHKKLADARVNGQPVIYRFDDPPVTSEPGQPERRNNPGQDFNCRCKARPVVRKQKR